MIPADFLARVIEDTDLVALVGESVTLKKAGHEYAACCPFHDEKTPSFSVSPRKQFYHCFGCGAHGNAIDWSMAFLRMEFRPAVEHLAKRLGREIPDEKETPQQVEKRAKQASITDVLRQVDVIYRSQLRESPEAITYLRDTRGISGKTAAEFLIGWAPPAYHTLRDSGINVPMLIDAGMVVETEKTKYDRFRSRIMFPIRDTGGRIVGFGGRLIAADGKPKYLNSPETPVFKKGRLVYGLYEYLTDRERTSPLLIVEGYMDVVQLAEHGISAGATLGTAVTPEQVALMFRHCDAVQFVFDGDVAGQEAAWRALDAVLPYMDGQRSVTFVALPDGKDPDDLVRELGPVEMRAWLSAHAMSVSDFILKQLPVREGVDVKSPEGLAKLIAAVAPLIAETPAGVYRETLSDAVRNTWKMKVKPLRDAVRRVQQQSESIYTPGWRSAWEEGFARTKEGNVRASLHNVILILENHPLWQGMFAMNEFANQIVLTRAAPWSNRVGQLEESDGTEVAAWIGNPDHFGLTVASSMVLEAIEAVAKRRRFHPVLDYLDSLKWDGTPRLDHMLTDFFSADFNDYTAACGRNMMLSAVARVRVPGCKVDEMIILEGDQGVGKSSAVRALCGPEWFAEMLESPQSKDFYQVLTGRWIIEIPELQAFNKADRNKIKAAVSAQEDTYRPSYGRYARQFPRQNIFIGTTNDEAYLKDETGARRFMPVTCRDIDVKGVAEMRDQLWAEANARFLAGEPWYKFPREAKDQQDIRFDVDAWEDTILDWLNGNMPTERYPHLSYAPTTSRPVDQASVAEIMRYALSIEVGKHAKPDQMRVGSILRHLGWRRKQNRDKYGRRWFYERPKVDE